MLSYLQKRTAESQTCLSRDRTTRALPEKRALCGEQNRDNQLRDCLALNTTSKQWQRGVIENLDEARIYASAVTLPVGVFVLWGNWWKGRHWALEEEKRSLFMKFGLKDWVEGPSLPIKHKYGCVLSISKNKLLMTSGWNLREFDTSIEGPRINKFFRTRGMDPIGLWLRKAWKRGDSTDIFDL